jgi:hypothetical protein
MLVKKEGVWVTDYNPQEGLSVINIPDLGDNIALYFSSDYWVCPYDKGLEQYKDPMTPAIVVLFKTAHTQYMSHDKQYNDVIVNYDWLERLIVDSGREITFSQYLELKKQVEVGEYDITHTYGDNAYYTYHYLPLSIFNQYLGDCRYRYKGTFGIEFNIPNDVRY